MEADIEDKAVDIALLEGVKNPKIFEGLKRNYPIIAEKMEIEATVVLEVIINIDGQVVKVIPLMVKLNKVLPITVQDKIEVVFSLSAVKMLTQAQFIRPEVNGEKYVPIKLEAPLEFTPDRF